MVSRATALLHRVEASVSKVILAATHHRCRPDHPNDKGNLSASNAIAACRLARSPSSNRKRRFCFACQSDYFFSGFFSAYRQGPVGQEPSRPKNSA